MSMKPLRAALALVLGLAGVAVAVPAASAIDEGSNVDLAIAVPIVVGPRSTGLISADELEAYTRPLGELTRQLDAVIDRPVAIGIDPMIIVSIRVLGTSAPESATAWLSRLADASNETFALSYADSDATLATQAGSPRVLAPQSFDFAIDPTLFGAAVEPPESPSPTPTEDPDEPQTPTLPTSDDLVAWPYTFESLGWPRANTVVASDLAPLSNAWDSVILSSGNVARPGSSSSVVDIDGTSALIADDAISAALATAVAAPTPADWSAAMTALDESLSAAARVQAGTASVLATLDRGVLAESDLVTETINALSAMPGLNLVPLSEIAEGESNPATIVDKAQDGERVNVVSGMLNAESAELDFSSIIETPQLLTAPRRLQLLALTSSSWLDNSAGWSTATSDFLSESNDIRASVQIVESTCCNLLGDSGDMPISVDNALDFPVTVYITVRPETALIAVRDDRVELVVEPNSQGKGEVPVEAISNGTVQVFVTLSSGTGVPIGLSRTAEINVQAGWETPIVAGLGALVIIVFGVGIVRNILRRRKMRTEEAATDD